jgi:hypothetical protein
MLEKGEKGGRREEGGGRREGREGGGKGGRGECRNKKERYHEGHGYER